MNGSGGAIGEVGGEVQVLRQLGFPGTIQRFENVSRSDFSGSLSLSLSRLFLGFCAFLCFFSLFEEKSEISQKQHFEPNR